MLACVCVAAGHRVKVFDVELASIEAKGPHYPIGSHGADSKFNLGKQRQADTQDLDGLIAKMAP